MSQNWSVKNKGFFGANSRCIIGAMKYGYARVSTDGQSVDAQVRQLTKAGCKKVFREVASGAKAPLSFILFHPAALRQKLHLSICPNLADHLSHRVVRPLLISCRAGFGLCTAAARFFAGP
jgi:hypothetical protein